MISELQSYLIETATPQQGASLTSAQNLFDRLGMEAHDDAFLEILMCDDDADSGETMARITDLTDQLLVAVLSQHGIMVTDDATVQDMTAIVTVLLDIPGWEDQHGLLVVAQQPKATIERLAELVEIVSGSAAETTMTLLDSVEASLLCKIASLCGQNLIDEDELDSLGFRQARLDEYRKYVDQNQLQNTQLQVMIANGLNAGYPFRLYLDEIGRELEQLPPLVAAQELVGMAVLSSDAHTNPDASILPQLEFLIADPDQRTRVHAAARNLIHRLNAK